MGTVRVHRLIAALAATALIVGSLAGCGAEGSGDRAAPATPVATTAPSPPASVAPSKAPPAASEGPGIPPAPPGSGPANGEVTITGQVEPGVEANCLLIRTGDQAYLLLGGDRSVLKTGARFTVRGRVAEGVMSTCQQGTPFQVLEARPA